MDFYVAYTKLQVYNAQHGRWDDFPQQQKHRMIIVIADNHESATQKVKYCVEQTRLKDGYRVLLDSDVCLCTGLECYKISQAWDMAPTLEIAPIV